MPVVPLKDIVDRAFAERYGVAAINIVNDLTLEAVLAAAAAERSPLIVQTSGYWDYYLDQPVELSELLAA